MQRNPVVSVAFGKLGFCNLEAGNVTNRCVRVD